MHNYNFDSDTEFNYDDNSLQKQNTTNRRKNLVGFLKKASVLKENSHKDYNQINKVKINETMVEDETFFSPGEYENDILNISTKPGSSREIFTSPKTKRLPNNSLVQIPEKKKRSPQYAYEDEPVRRKNERAKLDGWSCWDCKKYYQDLNLPENELKERLKQCSRHKYKYDPNYYTPPGFWNPGFPDTLCPTFQEPDKE